MRERHSRKDKMLHTTEDVIHNMLTLLDPVVTSIRTASTKVKRIELPEEF